MWLYHRVMSPNDADGMANSVDPDQTAPLGAVWSGSALFAQAYLSENLGTLRYSKIGHAYDHYDANICQSRPYSYTYSYLPLLFIHNSIYQYKFYLYSQRELLHSPQTVFVRGILFAHPLGHPRHFVFSISWTGIDGISSKFANALISTR